MLSDEKIIATKLDCNNGAMTTYVTTLALNDDARPPNAFLHRNGYFLFSLIFADMRDKINIIAL